METILDLAALQDAIGILSSQLTPWMLVVPGLLIGLVAGAIPGFGPGAMLAILLPVAYHLDFLSSMIFMTAIFTGGGFGVAIPSILINVPGSPAAMATCFDGFPMTQKGMHNEALGLALSASVFGTALSYLVLLLCINFLAGAVLSLGPVELLIILLWGVSLIALMGGSLPRGLIAGLAGLLLGTVGFGLMGTIRGTMGSPYLLDGVALVPAMVGIFAGSEMLRLMHVDYVVEDESKREIDLRRILRGAGMVFTYPRVLIRGSVIGALIGMLPGVGSALANLLSYQETRRSDPHPEDFGTGTPKGVVAAESANSSSEGGSMLTLLALGIPGGAATAMLYTVFSVNNITGGPRFYNENKDIVFAIVLNNLVQALLLLVLGLALIRVFAGLVRVPTRILVPSVLATALVSTYAVSGNMVGPVTALIFGVLGWMMLRHGYSRAAMVVGLLLGQQLEAEALRSVQISAGSVGYLLERPIALGLAALLLLTLGWPAIRGARATLTRLRSADDDSQTG